MDREDRLGLGGQEMIRRQPSNKGRKEVSKSGLGLGLVLSCLGGPGVDGAGTRWCWCWCLGKRAGETADSTVRTDSGGKDDENKAVGRVRAARMMDATDWGSFGGASLGREHQPLLALCTAPGGSLCGSCGSSCLVCPTGARRWVVD